MKEGGTLFVFLETLNARVSSGGGGIPFIPFGTCPTGWQIRWMLAQIPLYYHLLTYMN